MRYRSISLSFLVSALLGISQAARADWTFFAESNNDAKVYYEPTSVTRDGENVRVWTLIDLPFKQHDGSLSLREYWEMNCKEVSYRILQQEKYPQRQLAGLRISGETNAGDWRYIGPNNIDRMILKKVCA